MIGRAAAGRAGRAPASLARVPSLRMGRRPGRARACPSRDPWPGRCRAAARGCCAGELEWNGAVAGRAAGRCGRDACRRRARCARRGARLHLAARPARARHRRGAAAAPARWSSDWMAHLPGRAPGARPGRGRRADHRLARPLRLLRRLGRGRVPPAADGPAARRTRAALAGGAAGRGAGRAGADRAQGPDRRRRGAAGAAAFLTRALRYLPQEIARQVLPDGCHVERSPAAQLAALQDLTEIRALLQAAQAQPPAALASAIERMAPGAAGAAPRRRRAGAVQRHARRRTRS